MAASWRVPGIKLKRDAIVNQIYETVGYFHVIGRKVKRWLLWNLHPHRMREYVKNINLTEKEYEYKIHDDGLCDASCRLHLAV